MQARTLNVETWLHHIPLSLSALSLYDAVAIRQSIQLTARLQETSVAISSKDRALETFDFPFKYNHCYCGAENSFMREGFHPHLSRTRKRCFSCLVHGWDRTKNVHFYSLLGLSTHKNEKCYPTMTKMRSCMFRYPLGS